MAELRAMVAQGKLAKLTVPELKEACRCLGLTVGGKKDDLVARVTAAL